LLRKIFGSNREGVTGEWRRLRNKELNNLYCSSHTRIMRLIQSGRMRWTGHVARTGVRRGAYSVLVGRPEGKTPNVDLGIDGRIILKWISMKWVGKAWTGLIWLRIGTGGGLL
jgi:hypothetical protein